MEDGSGGSVAKDTKPPRRKRHIRLAVIPEPEPNTRTVLLYTGEGTVVIRGSGPVTMDCGNCGAVLAQNVEMGQLQNLVLRCKNCGAFNETLI